MKLYQISAWDALKICKRGAQNSWLNNISYYMTKEFFIVIDIITFN